MTGVQTCALPILKLVDSSVKKNPMNHYPRNPLSISDIEGTSSKSSMVRKNPHDPLFIGDIEGSSTKTKKILSPGNPLRICDIEGTSYQKSKVRSKPKNPLFIGDIEGTMPSEAKEKRKNYDNINYADIKGMYTKNASIDVPRHIKQRDSILVTKENFQETEKYKNNAKQEMKLIRAVGLNAAKILREVRILKRQKSHSLNRNQEFHTPRKKESIKQRDFNKVQSSNKKQLKEVKKDLNTV